MGTEDEETRPGRLGRQIEPTRARQVIGASAADLPDHQRPVSSRRLHGPQRILPASNRDQRRPGGGDPPRCEPRRIGRPEALPITEARLNPDDGPPISLRSSESGKECAGRRRVQISGGSDLVDAGTKQQRQPGSSPGRSGVPADAAGLQSPDLRLQPS